LEYPALESLAGGSAMFCDRSIGGDEIGFRVAGIYDGFDRMFFANSKINPMKNYSEVTGEW
jgi:hypothetical protein